MDGNEASEERAMELTAAEQDLLGGYLAGFASLAGDRRPRTLLGAVVQGIIGSESLCCSRIAAFSPQAGGGGTWRAAGATDGPR